MDTTLTTLFNRANQHYQDIQHKYYVVKPAIPILYFGDINAYNESKIKIITVGKNPSLKEFVCPECESYSFFRFPDWEKNKNYAASFNPYFEKKPYRKWFSSYQPILEGINASYYSEDNLANRAIHTDIYSPIATNPTWSQLPEKTKNELFDVGFPIWKDLINILQPDILLISLNENYKRFDELKISLETKFETYTKTKDDKERKHHYIIYKDDRCLDKQKVSKVYFGQQLAETPFSTLSNNMKKELGQKILKEF